MGGVTSTTLSTLVPVLLPTFLRFLFYSILAKKARERERVRACGKNKEEEMIRNLKDEKKDFTTKNDSSSHQLRHHTSVHLASMI